MATSDHFGLELKKVLPRWAEPLWANTLRDNRDRRGKRRRKAEGEGERRRRRKREEKEKSRTGAKRSKSGEPDNMPRLATKRGREKFERDKVGVKRETRKGNREREESGVRERTLRNKKG